MVGGNRPRHLASQPQIFHGYCQINHDLSAVWGIARINDATFGIEAAFVFLWEVYSREYPPRLCLRDEALAEIDEFPTTRQSLSPFAQFLAFLISSRESNEFRDTFVHPLPDGRKGACTRTRVPVSKGEFHCHRSSLSARQKRGEGSHRL